MQDDHEEMRHMSLAQSIHYCKVKAERATELEEKQLWGIRLDILNQAVKLINRINKREI